MKKSREETIKFLSLITDLQRTSGDLSSLGDEHRELAQHPQFQILLGIKNQIDSAASLKQIERMMKQTGNLWEVYENRGVHTINSRMSLKQRTDFFKYLDEISQGRKPGMFSPGFLQHLYKHPKLKEMLTMFAELNVAAEYEDEYSLFKLANQMIDMYFLK